MRRCLAAAFALLTMFGSGCATTPAERPPEIADQESAGAGSPAVPAEESLTVLKDLAGGYNKAVRTGAPGDWRDVVGEALRDAYTARARMYGPQPGAASIELLNPAFYVPRSSGYPRWFAASALESSDAVDDRGDRQVLLMFVRRDESDRWRAAHRLEFKGRPPALDLDGQGYAQEVRSPAVSALAAAHVGYLAGRRPGQASPAASPAPVPGFSPDAFTTRQRGLADAGTERAGTERTGTERTGTERTGTERTGTERTGGWSKDADRFEVAGHAPRALRTADGGALVWYDLRQTKTYRAAGVPVADGLPPEVRTYLARLGGVLGDRVTATWTWLAIGYVPADGDATVLGESLYLTEASSGL